MCTLDSEWNYSIVRQEGGVLMSSKSCKKCYYYGECDGKRRCVFFTPVDDTEEEKILHKQIEEEREEFRKEWFRYTSDF